MTERLTFRRWTEADAPVLYKYASDPEVGPQAGWPPHKSVEESLDTIRTIFNCDSMWAIVLKETGEPIGCIGYLEKGQSNIEIGENDAEIGYWVARPYWNLGICTEALEWMIGVCFNERHFKTIWGDYFVDNPASGRVMQKCGFEETGVETTCPGLMEGNDRTVRVARLDRLCQNRGMLRHRFNFNTIGLFTTDNARMVAFYRDIFGFTTDWNGEEPNVEMCLGGMRLIMFPRTAFEQMISQKPAYPDGWNGTMELSFDVPTFADVDKEYLNAVKLGATPVLVPTTEPWGQRTCYVADPEGNLIEISSFTDEKI